jgi:hypothetical protein
MTRNSVFAVTISALLAVVILAWVGIRFIVAERNSAPSYIMTAGTDTIRQEWGYSTRFDNETKNLTRMAVTKNRLNTSLFSACRPLFRLENLLQGDTIGKGDVNYDRYMKRVQEVRRKDWDYVISSHPDGKEMYAVKDKAIIQRVD